MGYEKQTWQDGTTPVNASHMNHIEDGIAAVDSDVSSLQEQVDELNDSLTEQIESTATFRAGDSVSYSSYVYFAGGVTTSSRDIIFLIPLTKTVTCSSATFTPSILSIRGINGYIVQEITDFSDITFSVTVRESLGVQVLMRKEAAWNNAANNTPVSVASRFTLTFS